ncbi:MAG: AbgT family transporter [Bacteroidales bacterium]|nr:AbgT family transporter [Bacteroidales bacterium]
MKKRKVPHTFVIVFCCIVVAAMMTWFIKPGKYVQEQVDGESVMTFYYQDQLPEPYAQEFHAEPQTWQVFSALFKGFEKQSGIIVFILIVGGAFWILSKSRAIDTGIMAFLGFTKRLEHNKVIGKIGVNNIIITMIMILFSLFGSVFGMSEETIAFTLIIIPLAISMGYDSIVGVCMVYVAAHIGFSGAMLNPFTIGIAQGIADIPLFSGIGYRLVCWVILTIIGIIFVLLYANKVKKNPKISIVYEDDEYWRNNSSLRGAELSDATRQSTSSETSGLLRSSLPRNDGAWIVYGFIVAILVFCAIRYPMTAMKIGNSTSTLPLLPIGAGLFALVGFFALRKSVPYFILTLLFGTVYYLIVGVLGYGWYIMEIATLFLFMGVCSGFAIGKSASDIAKLFIEGMGDILSAAVVVGLAAGIVIVLQDGGVIDTILYGLSKSMSNLGVIASTEIMYGIQTLINIVIPSGSAKAAITMPIMAPFSDLIGISRQTTVMAFQFGDGFTNMITPTSGVLIATLGVARIPWEKWVRFIWKFILVLIVVGGLLLIPTVTMSLNGF